MPVIRDSFNKRLWISVCIISILIFSNLILMASQLDAKQETVRSSKAAALQQEDIDPVMLQKKLDEIYQNQEKILNKFQKILDEIQIVKIRATVR